MVQGDLSDIIAFRKSMAHRSREQAQWRKPASSLDEKWRDEPEKDSSPSVEKWIKITVEIPCEVNDLLMRLAKYEGISKNRLLSFTSIIGLGKLVHGEIRIQDYKLAPNSPRVKHGLRLPDIPQFD